MMRLHRMLKIHDIVKYFGGSKWSFTDDNVQSLLLQMCPADRKSFQFDVKKIVWDTYLENYVLGIRQFQFKQSTESLPGCRRNMSRSVYAFQYQYFI